MLGIAEHRRQLVLQRQIGDSGAFEPEHAVGEYEQRAHALSGNSREGTLEFVGAPASTVLSCSLSDSAARFALFSSVGCRGCVGFERTATRTTLGTASANSCRFLS